MFLIKGTLAQTAYFADGYHGGIYGHYPMWQARFMVEKLSENPAWKINLEIEPETWDTVSVNDSDNFKMFQNYYATKGHLGRIEFVNPTYAQPYLYNISGESIIRQFSYGMEKIKKYFPNAEFQTYSCEEPCFTSSLPQILKSFGYQYAVLRNPNTCWGGYTSAFGKDLVNWIGHDGTSLLAVPRYDCEELAANSTWQTESWTNSNDFITKCFSEGIKYPVGMCFQDAGWNGGPWGNQYNPTEYIIWTDYIDQIKDKVKPVDWNFTQEDINPGLVWGAQVLQKIAQEVRVSENRLVMAEKMATLDFLYHEEAWPAADFAEGWRTLMLAQHHDCWIVPYNGKPGKTWADNVTCWTNVSNKIANEIIEKLFDRSQNTSQKNIRVFNTLGFTRTDWVKIVLSESFNPTDFEVYNSKGEKVPAQYYREGEKKIFCFQATVPAFGFSTFHLKNEKNSSSKYGEKKLADGKIEIETNSYSAVIDPAKGGTITSLVDKNQNNRELVDGGKGLNGLCGYFYEEGTFHQSTDSKANVSVIEDGDLFTRVKIENQIAGNNYTQFITFSKNSSRIDFELTINWNGQPGIGAYDQHENYDAKNSQKAFYNDQYKLHLQFPLKELGAKLFKNAPFDVCESRLDNTLYSSWDSIKHNVILNWVDVENAVGDYGVALFSDHTTSYLQTDDLPLGLTVQYVGKGLWGRNYRIHGPTHLKYALMLHEGNWEKAQVEAASSAWNEPLIGRFVNADSNMAKRSLLEVADKDLLVSSTTVSGGDLYVRFYNASAKDKEEETRWNCTADKIESVDLNRKVTSSLQFKKGHNGQQVFTLAIPPFGFQTLKLTNIKSK